VAFAPGRRRACAKKMGRCACCPALDLLRQHRGRQEEGEDADNLGGHFSSKPAAMGLLVGPLLAVFCAVAGTRVEPTEIKRVERVGVWLRLNNQGRKSLRYPLRWTAKTAFRSAPVASNPNSTSGPNSMSAKKKRASASLGLQDRRRFPLLSYTR
jgi:hypothetical protein